VTGFQQVFDELMGELDYSMLIVTAASGYQRAGCLVGFATQCSIEPRRFLVCLSDNNRTLRVAQRAGALVVHLPTKDMAGLVELFGAETGDEIDKFERCAWHTGPRGLPVLDECPRWFAADVILRRALGDHTAFVLAPFAAANVAGAEGFPFQRARTLSPGHEP
jgi:flavin reductase (DIM6/NTAB) family NADH-FMN oxidoreductase RutF